MKKVLFLIESLSGGGAERVLTDIVKKLDKSKFDIDVITVVSTGVYIDEVKSVCRYKSFLPNPDNTLSGFARIVFRLKYRLIYTLPSSIIYRWFIKDKYDIEVAFVEGFATKIISSSKNKCSKKIAWVHTDMSINTYADNYFSSKPHHTRSYSIFHSILCVSKSVEDAFNEKFNLSEKTMVQYNPVDKDLILLKSEQPISMNKNKITMIAVGRLVEQKGYDRLLKICKRLKEEGFKFCLWILGEGEQRGLLEKYIEDNNLDGTVKLLGFQQNPYPYVRLADILVCSSRAEGFSTVATEAIILGKPVITTNCSGMRELLGQNEYGIIVDNNNESLYEALRNILRSKNLIENIKSKVSKRAKDFDINSSINQIQEILEIC